MPPGVRRLAEEHRGLVLVTGATGSGKSTTLAAMIDHINQTRKQHIITIEDPIEMLHPDRDCIVNQREVGIDTVSFSQALRRALRQDPDVILIGELRDSETAETALQAAESGHLVFSTMHTVDAAETIGRMIEFFPAAKQTMIRAILAGVLRGVVSQRLLPMQNGGRIAAVEVMVVNDRIAELIRESRADELPSAMRDGAYYDMQTLTQALIELALAGLVDRETATNAAPNPHDFLLALGHAEKTSAAAAAEQAIGSEPLATDAETAGLRSRAALRERAMIWRATSPEDDRSQPDDERGLRRARLRARARDRKLPQRRRGARPSPRLDRGARLELPGVPLRDRLVRQHPGPLVPAAARALPGLQRPDRGQVPAGRARDGGADLLLRARLRTDDERGRLGRLLRDPRRDHRDRSRAPHHPEPVVLPAAVFVLAARTAIHLSPTWVIAALGGAALPARGGARLSRRARHGRRQARPPPRRRPRHDPAGRADARHAGRARPFGRAPRTPRQPGAQDGPPARAVPRAGGIVALFAGHELLHVYLGLA